MGSSTGAALYGVWGSGPGNVFAVGSEGTVLHYDGESWQRILSTASLAPMDVSLEGVWGSGLRQLGFLRAQRGGSDETLPGNETPAEPGDATGSARP